MSFGVAFGWTWKMEMEMESDEARLHSGVGGKGLNDVATWQEGEREGIFDRGRERMNE